MKLIINKNNYEIWLDDDGKVIAEGHTVDAEDILFALGYRFEIEDKTLEEDEQMIIEKICKYSVTLTDKEKTTIKEARNVLLNLFDEMLKHECYTIECAGEYTYDKTDLTSCVNFLADFEELSKIMA